MRLDIHQDGTVTSLELAPGRYRVGGSGTDALRIPGAPAGLLELRVEPGRVVLVGQDTVSVDGVFVPPGLPRLLLPSEAVELADGVHLRLPAPPDGGPPAGTVALLRGLLAGGTVQSLGRAAFLVCLTGLDMGQRFPLSEAPVELGRGPAAAVRLRDRAVSRRHARLRRRGERFVVEDLGSPNGLFVNGRRADGEVALEDGALLELGRTLLRFQAPREPPEAPSSNDGEPDGLPPTAPSGVPGSLDTGTDTDDAIPMLGDDALFSADDAPPPPPSTRAERVPRGAFPRAAAVPGALEASLLAVGSVLAVFGCWVAFGLA